MLKRLLKPYDPKEAEGRISTLWEESGLFNPDVCVLKGATAPDAQPFSIVLPPPNVTGTLHLGHAMMLAVEDILVRYHRMKGDKTLWIPGTDHASIATQAKVESELYKKEKKTRHDLGRDEFLARVQKFAQESHDTIVSQIKRIGASLDWSREAYTLDEARSLAVRTAFKRMYDMGLIYRGYRVINWDPKGQTTISDDEIVYKEGTATLYTFKYSKDFPISISTTRPETKVGDTAVAVHPDDPRYKKYIGKEYDADFAGTKLHIKIIADESVDKEYGTGALGVTPAHSVSDFELSQKYDLPLKQVINEYARMTDEAGPLVAGQKTKEARETVVSWLRENGLLEDEKETPQNLSTSERTGGIVEPLPKLQWFVSVNSKFKIQNSKLSGIQSGREVTLKQLMRAAVESGQIKIIPERFEKSYYHWIDNLRDWCISRQIWYGHRVPVWHKGEQIYVGSDPHDSPSYAQDLGGDWQQDPDTLDTWFSSGLWTFSTLGWPNETSDLKTYHPTSLLETGYDILFFWVARMILMSGALLGDIPFKTVYLHGLVRDKDGKKMSKSLGNIIDPVDMIEKFGADAVRMALVVGTGAGNDSNLGEEKIKAYKHFANKIWNVTRFILTNTESLSSSDDELPTESPLVAQFQKIAQEITADIEEYRLHLAAENLYAYIWHEFADKIIEESKPILSSADEEAKQARAAEILYIWTNCIKLLHPFMPFITEEIWSMIPEQYKTQEMLMVEQWPTLKNLNS